MERKRRSIPLSAMMEIDSLDDSSDDSDFRVEDYSEDSNDIDTVTDIDSEESENKCEDKNDFNVDTAVGKEKWFDTSLKTSKTENIKLSHTLVCCICLGDISSDDNEIVECDCCGVTVHEDCYGVSDIDSVSSSDSRRSKISWFCDSCQAGKENPTCELCPNFGGIFKETDTGLWVHLVCALYIPGVAFREVSNLRGVTLFEMSYKKWGERVCSLCPDQQLSQTGVCIECDAGLCRTYFHVTCAQREGLLSEAVSEEIDHADPFYAHCKLHSDKNVSKVRRRNWLAFESRMADHEKQNAPEEYNTGNSSNTSWMKKKLPKYQQKYIKSNIYKQTPWIPNHKISRPLTSSSRTLRALRKKAILSGLDTQGLAIKEAQLNALSNVHRKWHITPAFNFDYVAYYLDRNSRISSLKEQLNLQMEENNKLINEQEVLQELYNQRVKDYHEVELLNTKLNSMVKVFLNTLSMFNSSKKLPKLYETMAATIPDFSFPVSESAKSNPQSIEMDVDTPCGSNKVAHLNPESLCLTCSTCSMATDQHLLVKCDTCSLYYHLNCLDPPLSRMPKKTKVMGWQCSECDKSSSDSDIERVDSHTPRQMRHLKVFESCVQAQSGISIFSEKNNDIRQMRTLASESRANDVSIVKNPNKNNMVKSKERKRCPSNIYTSGNSERLKVQKRQLTTHQLNSSISEMDYATHKVNCVLPSEKFVEETVAVFGPKLPLVALPCPSKPIIKDMSKLEITCDTCHQTGTRANIVTCDECQKGFHFLCLNPPVKKSPKGRGYSWHCTDCDPSESDSE